jgi:hypothetical protein
LVEQRFLQKSRGKRNVSSAVLKHDGFARGSKNLTKKAAIRVPLKS